MNTSVDSVVSKGGHIQPVRPCNRPTLRISAIFVDPSAARQLLLVLPFNLLYLSSQ